MKSSFSSIGIFSFILSLCLFSPEILFAETVRLVRDSAVIRGTLTGFEKCSGELNQLFVLNGKLVHYQISLPENGTWQVHLNPGKYKIVGISRRSCIVEQDVSLRKNSVSTIDLVLKPASATEASILQKIIPDAKAMSMCVNCLTNGFLPQRTGNFPFLDQNRFGYQMPWWSPFGYYSFNRFFTPCMWGGWGCKADAYPGNGPIMMGKPNLYLHGKKNGDFKMKISYHGKGNLLASAPSYHVGGMFGKLEGDGSFKIDRVKYPYYFYDYRSEIEKLQNTHGKCMPVGEMLATLSGYLESSGFSEKEITDFKDYWCVKTPDVNSVCVYPQTNLELSKIAKFEFDPLPTVTKRLVFVVITEKSESQHFRRPIKPWVPPEEFTREAKKDEFHVREWGIGFLSNPQIAKKDRKPLEFIELDI